MPRRVLLAFALLLPWCAVAQAQEPPPPRRAIVLIADGLGPTAVNMARAVRDPLHLDAFLVGAATTRSADNLVTDSAASATAMACGVKTKNGMVGVTPDGAPARSVLEAAQAEGLATGLVATSRLTHATPACFSAHVRSRGMEEVIAAMQVRAGVDVLLGGGRRWFLPKAAGGDRRDGVDLLAEAVAAGYQVVDTAAALDGELRRPLLGLFARDHLAYAIDRAKDQPTLAAMTRRALALLEADPEGLLLMVEGSRIDHAAHQNDPAALLQDVLAFDDAVGVALAFAQRVGHTLVVATADHETGGLSLGAEVPFEAGYGWHPEVLQRVQASHERLFPALEQGDPVAVARDLLGIDALQADERAALAQVDPDDVRGQVGLLMQLVSRRARVGWSTHGHTAADVGVWATGPGAERFRGVHPNTVIATGVAAALDLQLEPVGAPR